MYKIYEVIEKIGRETDLAPAAKKYFQTELAKKWNNLSLTTEVAIEEFMDDDYTAQQLLTELGFEVAEPVKSEEELAPPPQVVQPQPTTRAEEVRERREENEDKAQEPSTLRDRLGKIKMPSIFAGRGKFILIAAVLVLVAAGGWLWSSNRPSTPEPITFTSTPTAEEIIVPTEEVVLVEKTTPADVPNLNESWWQQITQSTVPELSPGQKRSLDAKTTVAIFMALSLAIWVILDALPRNHSQQGAVIIAVSGLLAGILTVPLLNWASSPEKSFGTLFTTSILLMVLWMGPVYGAITHKDWSALGVALTLVTTTIFFIGKLTLPASLGRMYAKPWPVWQGISSFSGWLILNMSFRFSQGALTGLMFLLATASFITTLTEASKRSRGTTGVLLMGVGVIILWTLLNWGTKQGVGWLISQTDLSGIKIATLEVIKLILVWLLGTLIVVGVGIGLSDKKLDIAEREIALGLRPEGESNVATASNFVLFATTISLLGILINF